METRPPVLIWSPHGPLLAAVAREAGWRVVDQTSSGISSITVFDARTQLEGVCEALAAARGDVRVALVSEFDAATQDRLIAAGATQIAFVQHDGQGLAQALALASLAVAPARDRRLPAVARSAIEEWLATRLAGGGQVAVIHVAIVRLDLVNAAHGRDRGTALIEAAERRIAAQVAAVAEEDGLVARAAGASLVAALALPADRVVIAAARIEEALARPFRLDEGSAVLGTRLGIAWSRDGEDVASLLGRAAAEAAPLAAPAVDDPLAVDVHLALARNEVAVLYQPQAAARDGAVVGVEALARWHHPSRRCLGAEELFAAAGRAGIGVALSEHIHRRVLDEVARWPAALAPLRVALNLTAADLARPGFVDTLLAHVDASGVARERLTLEVTETELMTDLDRGAAALAALQEAGCRTAIDDFGTGYSSLAYLTSLPVDYIKLDRALVTEVDASRRDRVVVRGIIRIAAHLGMGIIAEGVETREQAVLLGRLGCETYQGFLRAAPLDEGALRTMVEEELECAA